MQIPKVIAPIARQRNPRGWVILQDATGTAFCVVLSRNWSYQPGDTGDGPALATAATAHGCVKRRRVQQVVAHHLAVSLAITLWRLVRDETGVWCKDEVIPVHDGLHLRDILLLAPLTSSRGQVLCMVMAALYARRFRQLRHAIVLSKYTSHHNAIHNGTGATDVCDIEAGVRWLADEFQEDTHHIGDNNSDCVGRIEGGALAPQPSSTP